jgi:ABC-type transport system involved in multi-copper enzyme maturation permease subunit
MLVATLFLQPILVVVVGSEIVAGELESGGIRFSLMRASRGSVLLGKAVGLWSTIVLLTLAAHLVVWAVVAVGPGADPSGVLAWGPKLLLVCAATALAYVAIVTLIGFATGAPARVIAVGIVVFGVLRLARGFLNARSSSIASWLPGTFDERLLSPYGAEIARGLALVLGWSLVTLLAAGAIWRRRDA